MGVVEREVRAAVDQRRRSLQFRNISGVHQTVEKIHSRHGEATEREQFEEESRHDREQRRHRNEEQQVFEIWEEVVYVCVLLLMIDCILSFAGFGFVNIYFIYIWHGC